MKRIMVQLTDEQVDAVKELAAARNTSMAKIVRESVAQYVAVPEIERETKRRKALEFLENIRKHPEKFQDYEGKTDVSINHDEYFVRSIEEDLR